MRRALTYLLLASLLAAGPVAAIEQTGPVNITADHFVMDEVAKVATFTGQVVVIRADLTLWAPKVVVDYGEGGPSSIKSFVASGGVRIKTGEQDATGDQAIYDPVAETLRIIGNVMTVNASSTVGGADLIVDLKTNTSVFSGGRVTGIFTPQ